MVKDILLVGRKASKGNVTATENASTNALVLPLGMYDIEVISPLAPTGTTPTCSITVQQSTDGATFTALNDSRTRAFSTSAAETWFLRGVRITSWANGLANVGFLLTVTGTTPVYGPVEIIAHPPGFTRQYLGQP